MVEVFVKIEILANLAVSNKLTNREMIDSILVP